MKQQWKQADVDKALEIIKTSDTQEEAFERMKAAGIELINAQVWFAYNGMPKTVRS